MAQKVLAEMETECEGFFVCADEELIGFFIRIYRTCIERRTVGSMRA